MDKIRWIKTLCGCILLFIISILQSQESVDIKALDAYFSKMQKDWDVPSLSIGVVKDGELVFTGNYGYVEVGKKATPDKHTLYAIASNSKAFTTAIIGMLVQEGKLNWDDKVQDYLPYFEVYDPWVSSEVTIRDLLCHRVGLGTFSGDVIWYKSELTSEEIIKRIKYLPKAFDFRSGFGYSNLMYITAGELIKEVTGKSWTENVQERIFAPLNMNRTIVSPDHLVSKGNYATPHARESENNIPIAWEDWEEIGATGAIISSIDDLSKWMIFNLNHGITDTDTLLTKATRNTLWKPHNNFTVDHTSPNNFDRHFNGYGLGWGLSDYEGRMKVSHTGGYDGMLSSLCLIPDEKLGIVVLTNGMQSPFMAATYFALDRFLGRDHKDWSAHMLNATSARPAEDPRITNIKKKRVLHTNPNIAAQKCAGKYKSDIYGVIEITEKDGELHMSFEHSTFLDAKLEHWHFDVYEIKWANKHAWFDFGTVQFKTDNNLEVKGIEFEVPNNDIFFEELKPYKIE